MTGLLVLLGACGHVCPDGPQAASYSVESSADVVSTYYVADVTDPTPAECAELCDLVNDGTAQCTIVMPDGYTASDSGADADAVATVYCRGFVYPECL